jgi:type II secretory pathway pseudopilin PulG
MDNNHLLNLAPWTRFCKKQSGFSLVEAVTALLILALTSAGVVVVINRCIASAADSELRMQAFEVARENMEKLLGSGSAKETTENGTSDKYPEIKWETIVETFYEPVTSRMWVRAVCSAEYMDVNGEEQTVELTHWLTDVTKEQLLQIMANKEQEKAQEQEAIADQLIQTEEEAAKYAGVDVATVQKWVENGMVTMEDGSFVKKNLDLFKENAGNPPAEIKDKQVQSEVELMEQAKEQSESPDTKPSDKSPESADSTYDDWLNQVEPTTGLTYGELDKMDFQQIWELFMNKQKQR